MLWLYDGPLALVATAFIVLLVLSVVVHHPAARQRSREAMENAAQLSAHLVEDVSGVETVKAFGAERLRAEEGETRLVSLVQSIFSLQKLGISMDALGMFVTAMAGVVILWYGGYRVMDGALTIGQLMFFYSLLGYLLGPLERLASVNLKLQDALVAVDRLYQILDLEVETLGDPSRRRSWGFATAIELQDVSFHYGCRADVLEQVTLRIPAGKTVAIVGESGSGKSTLLKLLMGFYAPTAGRILHRRRGPAGLRAGVAAQPDRTCLPRSRSSSTARCARTSPSGGQGRRLEEVVEAARAAGLEEFIAELPERYETVIGERGANLSGGQRQRLAIARALLAPAGDPDLRRGHQPSGYGHGARYPGKPQNGPGGQDGRAGGAPAEHDQGGGPHLCAPPRPDRADRARTGSCSRRRDCIGRCGRSKIGDSEGSLLPRTALASLPAGAMATCQRP